MKTCLFYRELITIFIFHCNKHAHRSISRNSKWYFIVLSSLKFYFENLHILHIPPFSFVARDSSARLTISSPLEAHRSYSILFHIVGVDVGFENPTFACLELDYEDSDQDSSGEAMRQAQQTLTYYELDLGGLIQLLATTVEPIKFGIASYHSICTAQFDYCIW